jgi:hypothetical protein
MAQTATPAQAAIAEIEDPAELARLAELAAAKAVEILGSRSGGSNKK